jgi:hypothetical protein
LPGEIIAAFLWAQLENAERITERRLALWQHYHQLLAPLEMQGKLRRPIMAEGCQGNGHMYYVLLAPDVDRRFILEEFNRREITCVFHYVPLHLSPAGRRFARTHGSLAVTGDLSAGLLRLPLWIGLEENEQIRVVETLTSALTRLAESRPHTLPPKALPPGNSSEPARRRMDDCFLSCVPPGIPNGDLDETDPPVVTADCATVPTLLHTAVLPAGVDHFIHGSTIVSFGDPVAVRSGDILCDPWRVSSIIMRPSFYQQR